jgi:hypothetical protein
MKFELIAGFGFDQALEGIHTVSMMTIFLFLCVIKSLRVHFFAAKPICKSDICVSEQRLSQF